MPDDVIELAIKCGRFQREERALRFILGSDIMEGCWKFPWTPDRLSSAFDAMDSLR